jgi:crotonobetainyl-CoA:carnitine CoA-transferase CaiB-like acyl-CoA transferase
MSAAAPLAGIKVLELARILAGPWAGQLLADLGAEVIKVESAAGDDTRGWGPPFVDNGNGTRDAAYFHAANRGKTSEIVDLASPAGQARVKELACGADVLIENFKVRGLVKYGLDYLSMATLNPRLVYCSITGFGQDGPYAQRPGYDFVVQAMSGIMDLTGEPAGVPQKIGVAYADILSGLYAVIGIQAALAERLRSGRGQQIDIALLDVMVGTLANQALNYLVSGVCPVRLGNAHPNIAPYEVFPTADGWFVLAVGNDEQFRRFWQLMGFAAEPRFATNAQRVDCRAELSAMIGGATGAWQRDLLLSRLQSIGVPAGPINSVAQAFADPQIQHRKIALVLDRDDGSTIPGVRIPIRFSRSQLACGGPSPMLGEKSEPR